MNPELLLLLFLAQGATEVPRTVALVDVAIVDVAAGKLREHQTIVLRGDHIDSIGPADATPLPEGASIVARGGFALPGLWDMHVHLTDSTEIVLPVLVAHGITGVRDMGGDLDRIDVWRAEIDSGARIGPRIVRCGPYLDGSKPGLPYRVTLTDAGSARAAVEELADRVDFLKVHNLVPREAYLALAEAARGRGIPIAGHVPVALSPIEAVRAGQECIEHITSIFEARFVEPHPRDPKLLLVAIERFVAEDHELLQALREAGTWITPTLVAVETRARRAELADAPDPRVRWIAASLRRQWDDYFPLRPEDHAPEVVAARSRFLELMLRWTGRLHAAGVPLLLGTDLGLRDVFPGASVVDELRLLVRAGLTPAEALRCGTFLPARYLGREQQGALEAGKAADLVLVASDPLQDVGALADIRGVVLRGLWHPREELDRWLESAAQSAKER